MTLQIETIHAKAAEELRARIRGDAYLPGDADYDVARAAWNLNAHQKPAVVVMAEGAADVVAAVRFTRDEGLGVGVMATGHGTAAPADGGVLVNTSRMKGVNVDPQPRTARVEAGAKWADVVPEAAAHRLAGLPGSSSQVGVVGYTMGGGFGWLGRKYGFNSDSVREAEVVTADGELVRASAHENADLFWGLKGGGGNFGIVTSLEFALHPVENVYAGNLYYPVDRAREVLELYAGWNTTLPDEMMSAATFRKFPPMPMIPEPFRGNSFIAVRGCYCGDDLSEGERLIKPVREALGEPAIDTFAVMPYTKMDEISMDPVNPIGAYAHSEMLRDLSPETIETLVGLGSDSPLIMLELRQLGGALSRPPSELSPMGRSNAPFTMNAIGPTFTPEMAQAVRSYLAHVAEAIRPHASGTTYVNFMDLDGATPERVKAAYSPEDWKRLIELKDRRDPHNLFRFNRNIPPSSAASTKEVGM
jgi:FAD/FMN-containing dehydrogenase